MSKERLIYLPLGGAGEIGMNCYVYGYGAPGKERLIVVDMGVTFPDMDSTPGVDIIFADIDWLAERRDQIEGVFITHGHEDHIGAVGHTFARLGAKIYARPFTANLALRKLSEYGVSPDMVEIVQPQAPIKAGPFKVQVVPISHSIPESGALLIDTPAGRIVHTGDFKIDRTPGVGEPFDDHMWQEIGASGVKALVCDSTNVFSTHAGRSEAEVSPEITRLIAEQPGMVAATTFASNVARVKSIAIAAQTAGRKVCLLGRSMRRMVEASVQEGVLTDFPATIPPEDVKDLPRDQVCLIVTGSQGERRAATAQLANGKYLGLELKEGDSFLFSSKTIPGNERGVIRIMNQFSERGVEVIDDEDGLYHVSGHANRPDILRMHELVKPEIVIPMHGEHRHLRAHMRLAQEHGRQAALAVNGTMLDLTGGAPQAVDYVETGRTYLDGSVQIGAMDGIVRDRIRMALNGQMVITLIIDEEDEPLGDPWVDTSGLAEIGESGVAVNEIIEEDLSQFLGRAKPAMLVDDAGLEREMSRIARATAQREIGKKPEVRVIVSRLG